MSEYLDYDEAVRANRARKKKAMAMKRKRQAQIRLIKRNLFAAILLLVISVVVTKSVKAISSRKDAVVLRKGIRISYPICAPEARSASGALFLTYRLHISGTGDKPSGRSYSSQPQSSMCLTLNPFALYSS